MRVSLLIKLMMVWVCLPEMIGVLLGWAALGGIAALSAWVLFIGIFA